MEGEEEEEEEGEHDGRGGRRVAVDRLGLERLLDYEGHNIAVKACVVNRHRHEFLTLDSKSMRLWGADGRTISTCTFKKDDFLQCLAFAQSPMRVYLAAALDMTIKVYDERLDKVGQFTVGASCTAMVYCNFSRELITASGSTGCLRWRLIGNRFKRFP